MKPQRTMLLLILLGIFATCQYAGSTDSPKSPIPFNLTIPSEWLKITGDGSFGMQRSSDSGYTVWYVSSKGEFFKSEGVRVRVFPREPGQILDDKHIEATLKLVPMLMVKGMCDSMNSEGCPIQSYTLDDAYYIRKKHEVIVKLTAQLKSGTIKDYACAKYTRAGVILIQCFAPAEDYPKSKAVFKKIVDSLKVPANLEIKSAKAR